MMVHNAQLMPVIISELPDTNYRIWKTSVEAHAAQSSFYNFLEAEVPTPSANADAHLAKKGEAKLLLRITISHDIQLKLGNDALDRDPHIIYKAIEELFAANNTSAEHDRLRRKANGSTIRIGESLDDYLQRHMYLRREMQRDEYPTISNDRDNTVTHIIFGLAYRPSLRNIVTALLMPACKPDTIKKLKETLEEWVASQSLKWTPKQDAPKQGSIWRHYYRRLINYSTAECRLNPVNHEKTEYSEQR